MKITEIKEKLESAGCVTQIKGDRVYILKTPNGKKGHYGYCVAGEDTRDITANITKRSGEICQILRA